MKKISSVLLKFLFRVSSFCVVLLLIVIVFMRLRAPKIQLSKTVPPIDTHRKATMLTAFFGLDNDLPFRAVGLSWIAPGKDGMPIVFSQEIDPSTLDVSDFEITLANDEKVTPDAVTLLPASEAFELRTVLVIGALGNYPKNPPVFLKIIGDLRSRSGQNYKGQWTSIIPLEAGPTLAYAEYFSLDKNYPYVENGKGCDCPKDETQTVVRLVWTGGVRAIDGSELGNNELNCFEVTLVTDNDTINTTPFQLADLGDNDNNIDLCLKTAGVPIYVKVKENTAIDPRGDKNPHTKVNILARW